MMHCAPIPTLPTVGIVIDLGMADCVGEPVQATDPITEIAPAVMRGGVEGDCAGAVLSLDTFDFAGHDGRSFIPTDALIAGNAPHVRIAFAIRVEVNTLHRIEIPVLRVNQRTPMKGV